MFPATDGTPRQTCRGLRLRLLIGVVSFPRGRSVFDRKRANVKRSARAVGCKDHCSSDRTLTSKLPGYDHETRSRQKCLYSLLVTHSRGSRKREQLSPTDGQMTSRVNQERSATSRTRLNLSRRTFFILFTSETVGCPSTFRKLKRESDLGAIGMVVDQLQVINGLGTKFVNKGALDDSQK